MRDDYISKAEFDNEWGAFVKPSGGLFEFEDVKDQPLEHVWTIVDTGAYEDENWYAMPGFHIVNKLGYIMTRRAWTSDTPDAIYFLHEDEDDGERQVFIYQYRDASNYKAGGMLLLYGASQDVEEDLIRECCDAENISLPSKSEYLHCAISSSPLVVALPMTITPSMNFRASAKPRRKKLRRCLCGVVCETDMPIPPHRGQVGLFVYLPIASNSIEDKDDHARPHSGRTECRPWRGHGCPS